MKRVVVTGVGPVSPIGIGVMPFLRGLREGQDGITDIERFPVEVLGKPLHISRAGEIKGFSLTDFSTRVTADKELKRLDRATQYAIAGTELALKDAGLEIADDNAHRTAIRLGTGIGGIETMVEQARNLYDNGPRRVLPYTVSKLMPNSPAGYLSILFGIKGEATTVSTACASALSAIGDAYDKIRLGEADVYITGGTEAAHIPFTIAAFGQARALSKTGYSRPFCSERDGFVPGEGAGILVLEEYEHARKRGALIRAELVGYGAASDAHGIVAPHPKGEGLRVAMEKALDQANLETVSCINAHGTGTEANDRTESSVFREVFGDAVQDIPVSANKSQFGHLIGAAAGLESIAAVLSVANREVYPTINFGTRDDKCGLDYVTDGMRYHDVETVAKISLAFGGHNVAAIYQRV